MKTHYIAGPEIPIHQSALNTVDHKDFIVHGDGENIVDISQLDIEENSRVIINAHGYHSDAKHLLKLKASLNYTENVDYTCYCFQDLSRATNHKSINIELFSCYGGYALTDISHLPSGSTLITLVNAEYPAMYRAAQIVKESDIPEIKCNAYARFASYISINADDTAIAVRGLDNNHIFTSKTEEIQDYSIKGIKAHQKAKILEYAEFLKSVETDENNERNINTFISFTESQPQFNQWLDSFDTQRYQQILLLNAVDRKNISVIEKLLDTGVDVNKISPLSIALDAQNAEIVNLLLSAGADQKQVTDYYGYEPIYGAILDGSYDVTKVLLDHGADPNQTNQEGNSLLLLAISGEPEIVKLLLEYGANPNQANPEGQTPLLMAAVSEQIEALKLLLSAGATDKYAFTDPDLQKDIAFEIELFKKDPIDYILKNNETNEAKLRALNNLKDQEYFLNLQPEIHNAIIYVRASELIPVDIRKTLSENLTIIPEVKAASSNARSSSPKGVKEQVDASNMDIEEVVNIESVTPKTRMVSPEILVSKWERERLAKLAAQEILNAKAPDARSFSLTDVKTKIEAPTITIAARKQALRLTNK